MTTESPPARPGLGAAIAGGLLVLVALWEIIAILRDKAPDDGDWVRAAERVRAEHQPNDLIVFAPDWADPIGRLHLGDLIPLDMAARMDAARYARIWELSIRGAHAPDVAGLAPVATFDVGGVTVRRFERAAPIILADLRDRLPTMKVEGPLLSSPRLELAEVGFAPHRCIQLTPKPGAPVRMTFPGLPAGHLVGYVGLADVFKRRDIRTPATFSVGTTSVVAGVDSGWVRFTAEVSGDVTFTASVTDLDRLVCFAAEVRQ